MNKLEKQICEATEEECYILRDEPKEIDNRDFLMEVDKFRELKSKLGVGKDE